MAQTGELRTVPGWRVLLALASLGGNESHQLDAIAGKLSATRGETVTWIRDLYERQLIVSDGASDVWRLTFSGAQLVARFLDAPAP